MYLFICVSPIGKGYTPFRVGLVFGNQTLGSVIYGHNRNDKRITSPQNTYTSKEYGTQHLHRQQEKCIT